MTVEIENDIAEELATELKQVARIGYQHNDTAQADKYHTWARTLCEGIETDWSDL